MKNRRNIILQPGDKGVPHIIEDQSTVQVVVPGMARSNEPIFSHAFISFLATRLWLVYTYIRTYHIISNTSSSPIEAHLHELSKNISPVPNISLLTH